MYDASSYEDEFPKLRFCYVSFEEIYDESGELDKYQHSQL